MRLITGDIFSVPVMRDHEVICVLTNGTLKEGNILVMGAGQAKAAANLFPILSSRFGSMVKEYGNHVNVTHYKMSLHAEDPTYRATRAIVSFPTKNHWRDPSDLGLIEQSLKELVEYINTHRYKTCVIPRPGCGLGGLDWDNQVKILCEMYLDDRFSVIDFPSGKAGYCSKNNDPGDLGDCVYPEGRPPYGSTFCKYCEPNVNGVCKYRREHNG